ncbi:bacteriorhodopsin-like [soil metagenome]
MSPASIQAADVASGSFLLLLAAMAAATVLLIMGGAWVSPRWKLPVALASLVTLVATIHYVIATPIWLVSQQMPVVYRYVDWLVTVPIQVLCLYFFIRTVGPVPVGLFWRLLVASIAMVLARYMGEAGLMYPTLGFLIGLVLWLYVLGEVFFGRMSEVSAQGASDSVKTGYFWLRLIVTVGWALYPLCYLVVNLGSGADVAGLMVIYNLADLINQIAFVLAILATAVKDSAHSR